jgi:hypothetical protein
MMHLVRVHPAFSQGAREFTLVDTLDRAELPHGAMLNGVNLSGEAPLLIHSTFVEDLFVLLRAHDIGEPEVILKAWLLPWFCITGPRDDIARLEALIPHWAQLKV